MAKAPQIEQQLLDLAALRKEPTSELAKEKFIASIKGKSNLLAGKAATIILETNQTDYLPLLASNFEKFFIDGTDKGCVAKTAIANALYTFGHKEPEPFLRGIHHYQPEASWGPPVDAAAELRGICALGLVRTGYRDVLLELAALLVDKEHRTRIMSVRAVVYSGNDTGAPLLRLKALAGDKELDVTAECLSGLMKLSPRKSFDFVGKFLESDDPAMVESAALAIGESKLAEAFERLRSEWERHLRPEPRKPLLLAMAMTRQPPAIDFLIERILDDSFLPASNALSALAMYKHDDAIRAKIAKAITDRQDAKLEEVFKSSF